MIHPQSQLTLYDALDAYMRKRLLKKRSIETMSSSVNALIRWSGDDAITVAALTADVLNDWIGSLDAKPRTVIKHRGNILTLLRDASDDGWCAEPNSRKIRKPKKPKPQPVAWSIDELRRIVQVCDDLPGVIRRHGTITPTCVYFGCLVRVAYATGLRRGNLFSLQQVDVSSDGTIYVPHEKTGQPHVCSIGDEALRLFRQLPSETPLKWGCNRTFYNRWKKICAAAEVPNGGLHRIRKTAATQIWLEQEDNPTRVQQFLGHLTPDMWRHYVDRSQGTKRPPRPPAL